PVQDLFEPASRICIDALWVDGFAEFSPQELDGLAALAPFCRRMTLTLALDREPLRKSSWLSTWSILENTYSTCRKRFAAVPGVQLSTQILERHAKNRFERTPALQYLEKHWNEPPIPQSMGAQRPPVRIISCKNPEAEAVFAAREILRHVRAGGRYRNVSVL